MRKLLAFAILLSFVAPASAGHRHKVRAALDLGMYKKMAAPFMNLGETGAPSDLIQGITEQLSQAQEKLQEMMRCGSGC